MLAGAREGGLCNHISIETNLCQSKRHTGLQPGAETQETKKDWETDREEAGHRELPMPQQ